MKVSCTKRTLGAFTTMSINGAFSEEFMMTTVSGGEILPVSDSSAMFTSYSVLKLQRGVC